VAKAGQAAGYNLDHTAEQGVVRLVEVLLADHRHEIADEESMTALLGLLDLFAGVGWPEALSLVWRLDEVFR
jgi:hypothetical protein